MKVNDVFKELKKLENKRGIVHWNKRFPDTDMQSFGIGLTVLRKLAKRIGRNVDLAKALWSCNCYEAKVLSLLVDDPKKITREQAEEQVESLNIGMLIHVFSSCDATLAKSPIALELAKDWIHAQDSNRTKSAYGLWYELSKKQSKDFKDELFLNVIKVIDSHIDKESKDVRLAMGGALIGIGKRNKILNLAALKIAQRVGPIDFNDNGGTCDPLDVEKHLTSDQLKIKLGL